MDIDSLIGNTDVFPVLSHWDFFNHAGVAPIPRPSADAIRKFAEEAERGAYLNTSWYADVESARVLAAQLINAHRDEIAFVKNTSEGIATVAAGIDWQPGQRVVTTNVEYPANIYPWMELARSRGVELVMVPEQTGPDGRKRVPLDRILEEAAHPRTRLVSLSHVEFASGQRHDIAQVGQVCRSQGKLFCVDAIQTLGVLPVDVKAMNIDYLSADGHKWMIGPEGAGIFYCRRELLPETRPAIVGWMNVVNAADYGNYDYTLRPDAGRFEAGSYNVAGIMGLRASLRLLLDAGIDRIARRIREITDRAIAGLEGKGYQILSPRDGEEFSGIVSFSSPSHDHKQLVTQMRKEHKIELAVREGRLRISPHFYNTEAQIDRLIERLPGH